MMNRKPTWEGLSTELHTTSLTEAMREFDLDYTVAAVPCAGILPNGGISELENLKVTIRTDTNEPFGIVSNKYKIIQNQDALSFVEDIDGITLTHGGHTSWGSIWMIGNLAPVKVLDDEIVPNIIFQTSHNGGTPLKATICMLRIACQNQFTHSFNESPATIKVLHKGDVKHKVETAMEVLREVDSYVHSYKALAEMMVGSKVTPKRFNEIVEALFPISDPDTVSQRVISRQEDAREEFLTAYHQDDNSNFVGTRWGIITAYTDYLTHREESRRTKDYRFIESVNSDYGLTKVINYLTTPQMARS